MECRWCDEEARLEAPNEEEAYGMLHEWRLSMPRRKYHQRNWSCPCCAKWWQDTTPTATDTAGSAGEPAAKRAILLPNVRQEVQQLKAEIVELKAEVERLNAEVVELKGLDLPSSRYERAVGWRIHLCVAAACSPQRSVAFTAWVLVFQGAREPLPSSPRIAATIALMRRR